MWISCYGLFRCFCCKYIFFKLQARILPLNLLLVLHAFIRIFTVNNNNGHKNTNVVNKYDLANIQ